ncbi:hypothetical protein FZC84_04430 [Rossellomorea vietnamensis]|uniref:Uncharacterized protein n=1 Tax=Rossellomorea vietnamensis TaxID=218284 RepID=A0A5D4MGV1_9BACI|nr:hypothetical protein [Rossellomorea vietnamensis]TYS00747.1 hypothetical protein FZC84_04430 [Rossellomorea vietnamensis]
MKMKMNVSHANVYKNPKDISANFHYEIFASSEESGKKESQQLSNFANWKDFTCVVQEENHTEGSVLRFSVENKRRIHRRLKLFFLLDWKTSGAERLSFISPDDHLVHHYSSAKSSLVDYQVDNSNGMVRRSLYPLTARGISSWKQTLETGTIPYQPLLKGPALTVASFDLLFSPLQKIQGHVIGAEADSKDDLRNFHKHLKNRLAFHLKK